MAELQERLDEMEAAIHKPKFRESSGRANEVNYWVFDYDPAKELEVRERIEYMKKKNAKGTDGFELVIFDTSVTRSAGASTISSGLHPPP